MPTKKAKVSVIIPVRDRPELAKIAIESVENQTGDIYIKLIIVDDSELGLQKHFKNQTVIRNKGKHHPSVARNLGLRHVMGDYVSFLDADDFYQPNFLSESIKYIKNNPKSSSSVVLSNKIFSDNISITSKTKILFMNLVKDLLLVIIQWTKNGLGPQWSYLLQLSHQVYKREFIAGIFFDETKPFCEDWYFSSKVMSKGKCAIILKHLANYRYSRSSNTFIDPKRIAVKSKTYQNFYNYLCKSYMSFLSKSIFRLYFGTMLIKNV